jgi:hypothetical protein
MSGIYKYMVRLLSARRTRLLLIGALAAASVIVLFVGHYGRDPSHGAEKACGLDPGPRCMSAFLATARDSDTIEAAYGSIAELYDDSAEFRRKCHNLLMQTGEDFLENEPDYTRLPLSPGIATCDYGIVHGYARAYALQQRSAVGAAPMCEFMATSLENRVPNIGVECFRSVGQALPHLAGTSHIPTQAAFVASTCPDIAPEERDANFCLSGAFFAIGRANVANEAALSPSAVCGALPESAHALCMANIVKETVLAVAADSSSISERLAKIQAAFPAERPESTPELAWVLAYEAARRNLDSDNEVLLESCATFPISLRSECARGTAHAMAKHGRPGTQHERVADFCDDAADRLAIDLRSCLVTALMYIRGIYSPAAYARACADLSRRLDVSCDDVTGSLKYPEEVTGRTGAPR